MKKYILENLDCASCAAKLENNLKKLDCVKSVSIDFGTLSMLIDTKDIDKVEKEIRNFDSKVRVRDTERVKNEEIFNPVFDVILIIMSALLFIFGLIYQKDLENTPSHIVEYGFFLTIYVLSGWKVIITALKNIIKGRIFDEHFLMTIATIGAIFIHALPEAVGVMLFFRIGEFLETLSIQKSRKSVKALLEIRPDYANLVEYDRIRRVSPESINVADKILVRPGEKIPLDGFIISGESQVDTSLLTGESLPRSVKEQDKVLAGMINKDGAITIKVTKNYSNSSIARILELAENAMHKKAKTERFFTKFARYYTPIIVAIAALTAVLPPVFISGQTFEEWIYRALVILVISCPCALVVSIPLTYFGGIGAASRKGILIKGSSYLEALNSIHTIFFDKTGTITKGSFEVSKIITRNGFTEEEILKYAAKVESHSTHPIAKAIQNAYEKEVHVSKIKEYQEIGGEGITAIVDNKPVLVGNEKLLEHFNIEYDTCSARGTLVHVAIDGVYAGYLIVCDEVKDDSLQAILSLKKLGINELIMLTGDNKEIAEAVCKKVGIEIYYSELMPEDKVDVLESYMAHKAELPGKVAFVGDGINDTPALTRADIGIAMGSLGSDSAIEMADVVIMNSSLVKIAEAIKIARKNRQILIQNIVFVISVKVLLVTMGAMGIATMWEAVFGDVGVALIAILNASRMMRIK